MSKEKYRDSIRWDKLDNTANLFPSIAGESMTNVYRISVTLTENVEQKKLQEALDIVLPKFDGFNVRLRTGVFWHYFEENGKKCLMEVKGVTLERERIAYFPDAPTQRGVKHIEELEAAAA